MLQSFCKALNNLVYIALAVMGCYFIYHGQVWQRFSLKGTNFAEYEEPVTELPTIVTYIAGPRSQDLRHGKDFNLSLSLGRNIHPKSDKPILKMGKNIISDFKMSQSHNKYANNIEVDFEALWDGTVFKITPTKYEHVIEMLTFYQGNIL